MVFYIWRFLSLISCVVQNIYSAHIVISLADCFKVLGLPSAYHSKTVVVVFGVVHVVCLVSVLLLIASVYLRHSVVVAIGKFVPCVVFGPLFFPLFAASSSFNTVCNRLFLF